MGTKALRGRATWQDASGVKAEAAEKNFFEVFTKHFEGSDFRIRQKPREFTNIYAQIALHDNVLADIYNPPDQSWIHGVIPDYAIDNVSTKRPFISKLSARTVGLKAKSERLAGATRMNDYASTLLQGSLKYFVQWAILGGDILPFWIVFQGDIARDPKRVREVTCWFDDQSAHFHMWCDNTKSAPLLKHFDEKLKHLLL